MKVAALRASRRAEERDKAVGGGIRLFLSGDFFNREMGNFQTALTSLNKISGFRGILPRKPLHMSGDSLS